LYLRQQSLIESCEATEFRLLHSQLGEAVLDEDREWSLLGQTSVFHLASPTVCEWIRRGIGLLHRLAGARAVVIPRRLTEVCAGSWLRSVIVIIDQ
jgi:hypothetical protein